MPAILKALLSSALKSTLSLLSGSWGYVAVAAVAASVGAYGAAYTAHKFDTVAYQALQLKDAKALTASLEAQAAATTAVAVRQHQLDTQAASAAVAEAQAQTRIVTKTLTITKEVPIYVNTRVDTLVPCIPYGFVRVLDAAAINSDATASALALPPGQSDDSCAPLKASDLAANIAANYLIAIQNAEQLNALEAWVTQLVTTANK